MLSRKQILYLHQVLWEFVFRQSLTAKNSLHADVFALLPNDLSFYVKSRKLNQCHVRILWKLFFLPTSYKFQKSLRPQVEKVICITHDSASNEYTLSASTIICVNNADLIPPCASQSDCHCRGVKDLIFSLMPVRQDTVRALLLSSLFQTLFHL